MQVFVPDPDITKCAAYLDPSRLGNQLWREARILLNGGWPYHPASKMWRRYENGLHRYCIMGYMELIRRGWHYPEYMNWHWNELKKTPPKEAIQMPPWWGDERVHSSHRAVLLAKGLRDETYRRARGMKFAWLEHLPRMKAKWTEAHYQEAWRVIGKPSLCNTWYGKFGWVEDPATPDEKGKWPYYWPV